MLDRDWADSTVLVSYLPLRSYRKIPTFLRYALEVEGQPRESSGLVDYSKGRFLEETVPDLVSLGQVTRRLLRGKEPALLHDGIAETVPWIRPSSLGGAFIALNCLRHETTPRTAEKPGDQPGRSSHRDWLLSWREKFLWPARGHFFRAR